MRLYDLYSDKAFFSRRHREHFSEKFFDPVEMMSFLNDCGKNLLFFSTLCDFFHTILIWLKGTKAFGELKDSFSVLLDFCPKKVFSNKIYVK